MATGAGWDSVTSLTTADYTPTITEEENDYLIETSIDIITNGGTASQEVHEADFIFEIPKSILDSKQDVLNESQMDAVNSGITSEKVASYEAHIESTNNPHEVTKAQVGLGNVDNTSDLNKPVSTATQTALNGKQNTLTFDNTPTAGSSNPVTSAGIKSAIDAAVSSVYRYKGSVATYADLPSTGLTAGDVYNVEATGDNYAWTGTAWDKLAGTIDLSGYYTKTETDALLGDYVTNIALASELTSYGKKLVFTKYEMTTAEAVTSIEYNLHNTATKVLYFVIDKSNAIPSQNVTVRTVLNSSNYNTPSITLLSGNSKVFFFEFDCTTPLVRRYWGSYRYDAYGQALNAQTPVNLAVTSFSKVIITFDGDGIPADVPIYVYEGVLA